MSRRRQNPIRFTGPSFTFMPFNPFQKIAVDLLGVGLEFGGGKKSKKNPPTRVYRAYRGHRDSPTVCMVLAKSRSEAERNVADKCAALHMDPSGLNVELYEPDDSQLSLFGTDMDREAAQRLLEEEFPLFTPSLDDDSPEQTSLFNPPAPAWAVARARDLIRRNPRGPHLHEDPEIVGLGHEGRVQLYAQRIASGLSAFTGLPASSGRSVDYLEEQQRLAHEEAMRERARFGERPQYAPLPPSSRYTPARRPAGSEPATDWRSDLALLLNVLPINKVMRLTKSGFLSLKRWSAGEREPSKAKQRLISAEAQKVRSMKTRPPKLRRGRPKTAVIQSTDTLREDLEELRARYGTWERTASKIGVSSRYLSLIRSGDVSVTPEFVDRVIELLLEEQAMANPPGGLRYHYGADPYHHAEQTRQRREALHRARQVTSQRMVVVDQHMIDMLNGLISRWPSQAKLAKHLGLSKQHLTNILKGRRPHVDRQFYNRVMHEFHGHSRAAIPGPPPPPVRYPNPAPVGVHPMAYAMRERYHEDMEAGHDAAEYWRGQAAAYFTQNPPPGHVVHPELERLMNPDRPRRRNRDARWKREPKEYEIDLDEVKDMRNYSKAEKRFRRFHGSGPEKAIVIQVPDGKKEVTRVETPHVFLGRRKQTPYVVDEVKSTKNDTYWYHDHPEGTEPRMLLNPETGIVSDVGGSYLVDDWFYS